MKRLALFAASAAFAVGCAGPQSMPDHLQEDFVYDHNASVALNIARSAGIDCIDDLPYEDYVAFLEAEGIDPEDVEGVGGSAEDTRRRHGVMSTAVHSATQFRAPPPGFSPGAALGISVLTSFSDMTARPETSTHQLVWLPEGVELLDAAEKVVKAILLAADYDADDLVRYEENGSFKGFQLQGCEGQDEACGLYLTRARFSLTPGGRFVDHSDIALPDFTVSPLNTLFDNNTRYRGPLIARISTSGGLVDHRSAGAEGRYVMNPNFPYWIVTYYGRELESVRDSRNPAPPSVLIGGGREWFIAPPPQ